MLTKGCIEHSLGLELAAGGLARVGEKVVALAERGPSPR